MSRPGTWAAAAAALLLLAGAAWLGWRADAQSEAAAPAGSAASSAHLALPTAAPAANETAAPASLPAAPPRPAPSAPNDDAVTGIGSEGFGPHVQRALDTGDPRQALDAARWIASCRPDLDVESMINGTHPKYRLVLPPEARAEVITKERQNQRYCQTLTPALMAQHQALALRALDAKVPGAGLAYYNSLDREARTPAELERALQGLRIDVEHGEEMAVPLLALQSLGQSRVEQLAYTKLMDLLALKGLLPSTAGLVMPKPPETPYSPQEQAAAAALVTRLWPRFQRPG